MVRPDRPRASQTSSDVRTPRSAAKAPVERPAAATEPRNRLLIFIIDLQSQSFLVPVTQRFAETRPHFSVCVVVALRPTNDPMHGFARPTIAMSGADATAVAPKSRGGNVVACWLLQIQHSFGKVLLRTVNGVLAQAAVDVR